MRASLVIVLLVACPPVRATAQSRLSPDELVDSIQRRGTAISVLDDLKFVGCPQEDEHGRAVFEAVIRIEMSARTIWELSEMWRERLDCAYAPLWRWYEGALDAVLGSHDPSAALSFVRTLPADPTITMRSVAYIPALAHAARHLRDDVIWEALTAVDEALRRGVIAPSVAGLNELRMSVRSRSVIPPELRVLVGAN